MKNYNILSTVFLSPGQCAARCKKKVDEEKSTKDLELSVYIFHLRRDFYKLR